jgi:ligand-binding SRPBCC domain-containing protein
VTREYVLERTQVVPVPPEQAFAFFSDARNLERITPSWLRFRIVEAPAELGRGARLRYRLRLFGIPIRWRTEIVEWRPPRGFTDVQRRGPFLLWEHTHRLTRVAGGTEIYDHVRYRLFLGPVGALVRRLLVQRWVEGIFDYRARAVPRLVSPPAPVGPPRRTP